MKVELARHDTGELHVARLIFVQPGLHLVPTLENDGWYLRSLMWAHSEARARGEEACARHCGGTLLEALDRPLPFRKELAGWATKVTSYEHAIDGLIRGVGTHSIRAPEAKIVYDGIMYGIGQMKEGPGVEPLLRRIEYIHPAQEATVAQ